MSSNPFLPEPIEKYVVETITRESAVAKRLHDETQTLTSVRNMQTSPDQVSFLAMLVRLTQAKRIIEVGTFTGYSALAMAEALPDDGKIICCDTSKEWTDIARRYWQEAGVLHKIELRLAPALETLAQLTHEGAQLDMAFIDADKLNYDSYYEGCLALLKPGSIIALDNMLWGGTVADPTNQDASTKVLRTLNAKIRDDTRVDASLLTLSDGIMLVRKR